MLQAVHLTPPAANTTILLSTWAAPVPGMNPLQLLNGKYWQDTLIDCRPSQRVH